MSDMPERYRLSDITAARFSEYAALRPVILLPLGSHEDHGPHLPMGDFVLADMLAVQIAAAASGRGVPTFVAPSQPFGVADYFGSSPGGLALTSASFRAVLFDLLSGLLRHGLDKIIILNGHGGNVPVIHEVTLALKNAGGSIIPSFYLWKVARQLMEARLGVGHETRFGHGAEPLLSLSLALRPTDTSLMPVEMAPPESMLGLPVTGFGSVAFQSVTVEVPAQFDQVPADARVAALSFASAALGEAVAAELVTVAASFVCHIAANAISASGQGGVKEKISRV
jgi:creatinine amidohydrolase